MEMPNRFTTQPETEEAPGQVFRHALWRPKDLALKLPEATEAIRAVGERYRIRIPDYYRSLIEKPDDAIWRQAVPMLEELVEEPWPADVLAEDDPRYSPVPHLTHRYPDRALLLVTDSCPMYCRFCMRKRKTLSGGNVTSETIAAGIAYIQQTSQIQEVIVSGGDPLILPDKRLRTILGSLQRIPHVRQVRLHTRMPCVEPGRVTKELALLLAEYRPLTVAVHFNHPRELTDQSRRALENLRKAGLPLLSQTVLLRGVNDDPEVLRELYQGLMRQGVHPYYLHHSDLIPGTAHVRLGVPEGREIVEALRRKSPELAMLHYVLDTPGGGGKVPLEGNSQV